MKFLILSKDNTGLVVYKRLQKEGQDVWLLNPTHRDNGISAIPNIYVALNNNIDCAIITNPGFNREYNILLAKGIPIFGGSQFQNKVEEDRDLLLKLCKQYKIRILKESTKTICPLSVEIWFSEGQPLYPYISYIKQNRFLVGDLGPEVDESVLMWTNLNRNVEPVNRIYKNGLFEFLEAIKYTGPLAFDTLISEHDHYPYITNIFPRLQGIVLSAFLELHTGSFADTVMKLVTKNKISLPLETKYSLAVAVSTPPYPYDPTCLVKYLTSSAEEYMQARKLIAPQIQELKIIPNIQFRIDAGMQGAYLKSLEEINYLSV